MTGRHTRIVVAVLSLATILAACSTVSPLSIEEYADAAGAATDSYVAETQQLSYAYQQTVQREVEDIVASGVDTAVADATALVRSETVQYLALLDDAIVRYVATLDEMAPPGAVEDAHDSYVEVVQSVRITLPDMRDAVAASESIDGIQTALVGAGFSDGQAAWVAKCGTLEQAVRDQGRGLDLKCMRRDVLDTGEVAP